MSPLTDDRRDPGARGVDRGSSALGADGVLVDVRSLQVVFAGAQGTVAAVRDVSFEIRRGEAVALVGESGSGKSVTALSLIGLLPHRQTHVAAKALNVLGIDVLRAGEATRRELRGSRVAMVFQDPLRSLSPTRRIGDQIAEVLLEHTSMNKRQAQARTVDLLARVGIPDSARRARDYRHQFSGGQRQRIMIAMAIACEPELLIADEPTTALDVTTQAQVLDLVSDLCRELGMGLLLITHDLSIVARVCERVLVMYAGRVVESAEVRQLFHRPAHPYTAGLLASIPRIDQPGKEIRAIEGTPVDASHGVTGCPFRPRCPAAFEPCTSRPSLLAVEGGHEAACWLVEDNGWKDRDTDA